MIGLFNAQKFVKYRTSHEQRKFNKDVRKAIKFAAAEYKYVKELLKEIQEISSDINSKQTKSHKRLRQALLILRTIGKAQRRVNKLMESVDHDLKEIFKSVDDHTQGVSSGYFKLNGDLSQICSELGVEEAHMVKYASMYEGYLRHDVKKIDAQVQLFEEIKQSHGEEKAQKILDQLNTILDESILKIKNLEKWIEALQVTLAKAKALAESNSGLLTVQQFLSLMQKEILTNKLIVSLLKSRSFKLELEQYLLNGDYYNRRVPQLIRYFSHENEQFYFKKLCSYQKRVTKMLEVLKRIEQSGKYEEQHQEVRLLISILEIFSTDSRISKLDQLYSYQQTTLKEQDWYTFLVFFQQEKTTLAQITISLEDIGHNCLSDSIVKSGFILRDDPLSKKGDDEWGSILDKINQKYKTKPILGIVARFIVIFKFPTVSTQYTQVIDSEFQKHMYEDISTKLVQEVKERIITRGIPTKEVFDHVKGIYDKYKIKVLGEFEEEHLIAFKAILNKYHPSELQRILHTAIFIFGKGTQMGLGYYGWCHYKEKSITVFLGHWDWIQAMEHEIAHARTHGLSSALINKWVAINDSGKNYSQVRELISAYKEKDYWYCGKDQLVSGPALGYARPYGTKNADEDISTMVELVTDLKRIDSLPLNQLAFVLAYTDIYIKKAMMLYKFGFITKGQRDLFITKLKLLLEKKGWYIRFSTNNENRWISIKKKNSPNEYLDLWNSRLMKNMQKTKSYKDMKKQWNKLLRYELKNPELKKEKFWNGMTWSPDRPKITWLRYGLVCHFSFLENGEEYEWWIQDIYSFATWMRYIEFQDLNEEVDPEFVRQKILPYLDGYKTKVALIKKYDIIDDNKLAIFEALCRKLQEYE